jgi:Ser/Thr protein kinase RdoA (MazF antagonist)
MNEEPFIGGNISDATRVGDTVRRRGGRWTPTVHALLRFLAQSGFEAPRVIGVDELGREVLAYVEGEAHTGWPEPMPDWTLRAECLADAAHLLRRYHDVVAGFTSPPKARWRQVAPTVHEIICHNDWAPWNVVFRERRPAVMLDWDMAGPGSRLWDVANAARCWVPLYSASGRFDLAERAARLRLFADAYGLTSAERGSLTNTTVQRILHIGKLITEHAEAGDPGSAKLAGWEVPARMERDAAYVRRHRAVFDRALSTAA